MARSDSVLSARRAVAVVIVVVLAVAAAIGAVALTNTQPNGGGSVSGGGGGGGGGGTTELNGYTFVYHPGSNVTVVKQSFTTNTTQLTLFGPGGSVAWDNASGGATNMVAEFDYHAVGAMPGDTLAVRKRFQNGGTHWAANSTVPNAPQTGPFVVRFHQNPAVTVVNVHGASTGDLELVGPYGAVAWDNASLGSSPLAATFSYNRHAIGATAGDNVSLVRVQGSTRTTLVNATIP